MQQLKQYQYRSALFKQQNHVLGYKSLRRLNVCIKSAYCYIYQRIDLNLSTEKGF